ncbi:uncharacterized protein LOC121373051 [Gigantopelta aegis]|uniref:uncharacterized protein LOC121373051 n=1 Tax=Gigantopelta aegis TaxID=1735272 RepID=UPI001B88B138|nr:uncharacterized protein LOC121373051 [Gigantopelta aegis]
MWLRVELVEVCMEFEKFIEIGKTLGLEKADLQKFVKEQMDEWREQVKLDREERARERDAAKELAEANAREKELERLDKERERAFQLEMEHEKSKRGSGNLTSNDDSGIHGVKIRMHVFQDGKDDMDAYLTSFERMSVAQKSPKKDWAIHLGTLLTGKARNVYVRLSSEDAMDYCKLKNALLHRYDLTQEGFRQKFRSAKIEVGETYTQFLSRITGYVDRWIDLSGINQDYNGLLDLLLREQLLNVASNELTLYLKERTPESADKMAKLAETFVEARRGAFHSRKQEEKENSGGLHNGEGGYPGFGRGVGKSDHSQRSNEFHRSWAPKCFVCVRKGHLARECPNRRNSKGKMHEKEIIACMVPMKKDRLENRDDSNMNVFVGTSLGRDTTIIRDTGCSTVVIRKSLVPECDMTGEVGSYVTLDGEVKEAPWCETYIKTPYFVGKVKAMMLENPIYDIVIGNVIGAKDATTKDVAQTIGIMETRAQVKKRDLKMQPLITPTIHIDGVDSERIRIEQQKDEGLEKLFKLAEAGEETLKGNNFSKFVIENELLKRKSQSPNVEHGKLFDQLVVPTKFRVKVMRVAHETVLAGHMATQKTINRVQRHFYWPGLQGDIRRFCQSCDVCQRTIPKGRVGKALLGKMPVIDVPFERIAVDLVGPMDPMTDKKNRYILVIVDFATRYPEAVALKNINTRTVAEALLGVFGRVGIPKQILTDRGTQFTSEMMKEVCRLLSLKQLTTTPYHPTCNGLVERFNGTLKSMLKKMCIERPKDWDRYIAPLLFAYREVPQDSLGFSPFELLYGRTVRGPMQILKELWTDETIDSEVKTTYQYVIDLKERLEETCMLAHNELEKSSTRYRGYFIARAKDRQLKVGDQVLLLLPKYKNKLEMMCQGPNRIVEKLGSLDYRIKMDNGRVKTFHVNMLKKYVDREKEDEREKVETVCVAVVEEELIEEKCVEKLEEKVNIVLPSLVKTETWERCDLSRDLDVKQTQDMKSVLRKYDDVLSDKPGRTDLETFKLELTSEEPVRLKPYPIPFSLTNVVKEEVDQMLEMDVIEKTNSAYASPIVLVRKKEGTYRFCTDYRRLNQIVVYDAEPIPNIDELLSKMSGAKFFTKIDLCKEYWQIPVDESSRDATAFITPNGLYRWKVMPFGIVSAPAVFSRMMRTLLKDLGNVRNYIDDILIYTETWEEHLKLVETVLDRLRNGKLTAKPSKCYIGFKTLKFLGHMVGNGEIGPEDKKLKKIMAVSKPQNKKELRSFLGLIGYYRKFIDTFSEIAAPLTDMTKNSQSKVLQWTETTTAAFEKLKEKMSSAPVLKLPKLGERFTIRTDASGNGLGAVLMQESEVI